MPTRRNRRLAATIRYWLQGIDEATPEGRAFWKRCAVDGLGWKHVGPWCGAFAALVDREANGLVPRFAFDYGSSCYRRVSEVVDEKGEAYRARPGFEALPGDIVIVGYKPGRVLGVGADGRKRTAMWWGGHITICVSRVDTGPHPGLWCIGGNQLGELPGGLRREGVTLAFYPFERGRGMAVMWTPTILDADFTGPVGPDPTDEELDELLYMVKAA